MVDTSLLPNETQWEKGTNQRGGLCKSHSVSRKELLSVYKCFTGSGPVVGLAGPDQSIVCMSYVRMDMCFDRERPAQMHVGTRRREQDWTVRGNTTERT